MDNLARLQEIWGPLERGESHDYGPFFDSLHEDVVLATSAGEVHGKDALVRYFAESGERVEANPFISPLRYFGNGTEVVVVGAETFRVKDAGVTVTADWAWVHDFRDGKVSRILAIQDLTGVSEVISEAIVAAQ